METIEAPTREELVSRVSELVPALRGRAGWNEENRRLPEETLEALADAGVFRMRVPARYGGLESDARTVAEVGTELGRGDGSVAWTVATSWITTWMIGLFRDEVQDEVFATPDVRTCGTLSPSATAVPVPGGVLVNGSWGFVSGALHSSWQVIAAVLAGPDAAPQPFMAPVPLPELRIVDDWHTAGLRGSGSVTTVAEDVFVPSERILPLGAMLHEQYASAANARSAAYRSPLLPVASVSSVGPVLGMAKAAHDLFLERLPGRGITYTSYAEQRDAPLTHLQVADATLRIDEAEFHVHRLADTIDGKAARDEPWSVAERVRARVDMGRACQLAQDAVEILGRASGGSSIYTGVPIQQVERDVRAVTLHALMHPDTNLELYGRILCGLDPNTYYV